MTTTLQSSARISPSADILPEIKQEACSLAIWQRDPLRDVETIMVPEAQDIRFNTPIAILPERLNEAMSQAGFAELPVRKALIEDIAQLARRYGAIMALDALSVRLEIVTTDSCRKFHADYVPARLITTYVGSGSDWIEPEDAGRVRNGLAPRQINSLSAGDVGIFKGKLGWGEPIIHRSPPIAGTGERRLLLVLNPPEGD